MRIFLEKSCYNCRSIGRFNPRWPAATGGSANPLRCYSRQLLITALCRVLNAFFYDRKITNITSADVVLLMQFW